MNIVIVEDEESVQKGMDGMLHKINPDGVDKKKASGSGNHRY